jgi:hypothetical protein
MLRGCRGKFRFCIVIFFKLTFSHINFTSFQQLCIIISKKNHFLIFELFKDEAALQVRYQKYLASL